MRFACQTQFDITVTGITGHFKLTRLPMIDRAGQHIINLETWNRSRNQQRNWETLTQIIGLRTQLFDMTDPIMDSTGTRWMFEFETETNGAFGPDSDPCQILLIDAEGVPMLRGLNNKPEIEPFLCTAGPRQNIWFAPIDINTRL
jgi:hypothetical protein